MCLECLSKWTRNKQCIYTELAILINKYTSLWKSVETCGNSLDTCGNLLLGILHGVQGDRILLQERLLTADRIYSRLQGVLGLLQLLGRVRHHEVERVLLQFSQLCVEGLDVGHDL